MKMKLFSLGVVRPVRFAYQPSAISTFLSEQTNHQQSASSTFLSEQISTSHQPPAKRTGWWTFSRMCFLEDVALLHLPSCYPWLFAVGMNPRARGGGFDHQRLFNLWYIVTGVTLC
jgi:hypothetical protein